MKFLRFKDNNGEKNKNNNNNNHHNSNIKSGYLENNKVFGLKNDILDYFNQDYDEIIKDVDNSYNLEDIKIISPVSPSKIVCIGLNYKDHAEELNMELPDTPKLFIKPSTSVIGNNDNIIKPEMSNEIDYEGELAIVIGKKAKNIEVDQSKDYIFGYTIINDVTARDVQRYDEQWTRGKSFDTFAPIGPCIETKITELIQKINNKEIDGITFTSPLTVKNLFITTKDKKEQELLAKNLSENTLTVSIGPITGKILDEYNVKYIMPKRYTVKDMIDLMFKTFNEN